jgi:RNA polymerase sigma factor (sigma-70 family)
MLAGPPVPVIAVASADGAESIDSMDSILPADAAGIAALAASDESLMLRYAAGDSAAFDRLYGRYELRVWRYVLRSVRNPAAADDVLQDVWFAVVRNAASFSHPHVKIHAAIGNARQPGFRTWLFTIAHNRIVDYFRTARQHASLDAGPTGGDDERSLLDTLAADSGFGPLRQLQSREAGAALLAALELLPLSQREAFLLQAEGDLSVEGIAAATA